MTSPRRRWFGPLLALAVGCGDEVPSAPRPFSRSETPEITAYLGSAPGVTAILGPLPDPTDNANWHKQRIGALVDLSPATDLFALRIFVLDAKVPALALDSLRLVARVDGRDLAFTDLSVPPPAAGEDPEWMVVRARTRAAFRGVELGKDSTCELWLAVEAGQRPLERVTLECGETKLELIPKSVGVEQVAEVIARPTRINLRAVIGPMETKRGS